jgi:hypothetical protein
MRFEVPQFIEVEDKIIGPLTWKQFVYLAGGTGVVIVLFLTLPIVLFTIIGLPIGALAVFLAFHKVNNRPFSIFLESFLHFTTNNKLYLWRKSAQQTIVGKEGRIEMSTPAFTHTGQRSIASLSRKLELNNLGK